jgi:sulfite oxidase
MYPEECKTPEGVHVLFDGADEYGTSTPLVHILDPQNDCLLAIGMNGGALSPDHGYPLRAVLPGIIGARNVKWLNSIRLAKESSESPWQRIHYKNSDAAELQIQPMQSMVLGVCTGFCSFPCAVGL